MSLQPLTSAQVLYLSRKKLWLISNPSFSWKVCLWFIKHIEINWSPTSQFKKKKHLSFIHSISLLFFSISVASHRRFSHLLWPGNPVQSLFMDLLSCDKEYRRKFSVWKANFLWDFSCSWLLTNRRNFFFVSAVTYSCLLDPLSQISNA